LFAATLLCTWAGACGSGARTPADPGSATSTLPAKSRDANSSRAGNYLKADGDKDGDDPHPSNPGQDDQALLATYGYRASASTAHAIATLVEHYYDAALTGDGAHACALLAAGPTAGLVSSQSQTSHGAHNCATAIEPLLAQQHRHLLAEDPASMVVTGVYVNGDLGLALLGFRASPESDIVVEREGGAWKLGALIDSEVP
jgi:hypothetical protein